MQSRLRRLEDKRTKFVTARFSPAEFEELGERAKQARNGRGTTRSNYLRAQALKQHKCDLPPAEELRELRNTIIQTAALLKTSPKAMDALIRALDRISRF